MIYYKHYGRSLWGVFLIIVGLYFLLKAFGIINLEWSKIWPVLIILWGLSVVFRKTHCHCGMPWCPFDEDKAIDDEL